MQSIDYPDGYFDAAVSAFSLFFDTGFTPLVNLFFLRLEKYGIEVPSLAWKRVATKEQCISLFKEAGLQEIKSKQKECGYYLKDDSERCG